jgi:hypothetical protein
MATKIKSRSVANDPTLGSVAWFLALTDAQKDAEVAQYDKPIPLGADGLPGEPLTAGMKRAWNRARKKGRGRPVVGRGAKRILVTVEKGLLADADRFAKGRKMKRLELIAVGLRLAMKQSA